MTNTTYPINKHLKEQFAWLNNRPIFASISGGKDSTALGLHLQENEIKFTPLFLDTGWEHPATYEYINDVLRPMFGEFIILRNEKYFKDDDEWKGGMEQAVKYNKMFPSGFAKFCTRELKIIPVQNFYSALRASLKIKPINVVGIRAEESSKRALMQMIEEQDEATVWRPLLNHKEHEIIDMHQRHSILPNPLYLRGASRVGCYPCIYARKHEIRHLSFSDPERIDHIEKLEKQVNSIRRDDQKQATFFKSRRKDKSPMNIREIVEWSKQEKKQVLDDQDEIENNGCMRWGLCEPLIKTGDQLSLF
jgi:3'-phosphoadenosine 5'-phosphosulfate sulfotransferase (PAPS reductase)/FAD synthetase